MKVTRYKNCYCKTCKKDFHYLGIASHRAKHRNRHENCEITYTNGDTYIHRYSHYCDGCKYFCSWKNILEDDYCNFYKKTLRRNNEHRLQWGKCPRSQKCIKENGE